MDSRSGRWFAVPTPDRDPADEQAAWDALWPEPAPGRGFRGLLWLMARISVLADTVIWDEFDGLAPDAEPLRFEFDRDDYEARSPRSERSGDGVGRPG